MRVCFYGGCKLEFQNEMELVSHVETHLGKLEERSYFPYCLWNEGTRCTFTSKSRDILSTHLRCHVQVDKLQCKYCSMFIGERLLKHHLKRCKTRWEVQANPERLSKVPLLPKLRVDVDLNKATPEFKIQKSPVSGHFDPMQTKIARYLRHKPLLPPAESSKLKLGDYLNEINLRKSKDSADSNTNINLFVSSLKVSKYE
eukprot:NODE_424_length_8864_cov_0.190188.p4 type:complete len:200 gc:universal NODE_424_length_8864_cov_0.190188:5257-5856(+)